MADANLTAARLREILIYNPETGVFTNRVRRGKSRAYIGEVAGTTHKAGYRQIGIDRRNYKEHRLAWLYVYGVWPSNQIDHINGNRADNRISNLRDVTALVNMQNLRAAFPNSKSGLLGVHVSSGGDKWVAHIRIEGKAVHLGTFTSREDAHSAYLEAKRIHHPGCTI